MTEHSLWKRRVFDAIRDIGDIEFQRRAWLGSGPEMSSFTETYCALYDDGCFVLFLADSVWALMGLDEAIRQEMNALHYMMSAYKEPETDAAVLADPQWQAMVQQAQRILAQFAFGDGNAAK